MTLWLVLSLSLQLLIGIFLVDILWSSKSSSPSSVFIKIFLGTGIGLGITSIIFFLWLITIGAFNYYLIIAEFLLCVSLIGLHFIKGVAPSPAIQIKLSLVVRSKFGFFIITVFCVCFLFSAVTLIASLRESPHGGYDAWAIWNMHAKFLFANGSDWKNLFSSDLGWSHNDYPLLVPLSVTRYWEYAGSETLFAPALVATFFSFATTGLIVSSITFFRGRSQGALAGLVLLTPLLFIRAAASEYADTPLSFFLIATLVLLFLQSKTSNNNYNFMVLAGMTSGFAAWTKNEGLLILLSVVIAFTGITFLFKGLKSCIRPLVFFLLGLLPILIVIIYFKARLAPPNDLVAGQELHATINKLLDFSRYAIISSAFVKQLTDFDPWYFNPLYLLLLYPFCVGIKIEKDEKSAITTSIVTLCLISAGYFIIYLTTPLGLTWHLNTSLPRLLIHLFPGFVFVYFLIVKSHDDLTVKKIDLGQTNSNLSSLSS